MQIMAIIFCNNSRCLIICMQESPGRADAKQRTFDEDKKKKKKKELKMTMKIEI